MDGQTILDAYRAYLAGKIVTKRTPSEVATDVTRALYALGETRLMAEALALYNLQP